MFLDVIFVHNRVFAIFVSKLLFPKITPKKSVISGVIFEHGNGVCEMASDF